VDTDVETGTALIMTNRDAPMFKLMRVPMREHDESEWEVVIEEDPKVKLDWVSPAYGGRLLVGYLEDVKDKIYVHDTKSGRCLYKIPTPIGALGGLFCRKDQPLVFFSYESMLSPTTIFKADFSKCACGDIPVEVETVRTIRIAGLDEDEFEVKQVFYPSKVGEDIGAAVSGDEEGDDPDFKNQGRNTRAYVHPPSEGRKIGWKRSSDPLRLRRVQHL
jgi:prolyl oligopeptidase